MQKNHIILSIDRIVGFFACKKIKYIILIDVNVGRTPKTGFCPQKIKAQNIERNERKRIPSTKIS
jgi:hypothetical protein